jgi:hypothetical protein
MEIKSVPEITIDQDEDHLAVCSDVGYHDDDVLDKCGECGCTVYLRPETTVLTRKICNGCFRRKIKSGEISKEDFQACFTAASRKEVSKLMGREVSIGELVDLVVKEFE